jgi:hypothetical protein
MTGREVERRQVEKTVRLCCRSSALFDHFVRALL